MRRSVCVLIAGMIAFVSPAALFAEDAGAKATRPRGSNNVAYSTFFDIRHPDLRTESVTGVDTQYAPGSLLNVTATVVNEGRPLCQLCGLPMDPDGHKCPASNGHRLT